MLKNNLLQIFLNVAITTMFFYFVNVNQLFAFDGLRSIWSPFDYIFSDDDMPGSETFAVNVNISDCDAELTFKYSPQPLDKYHTEVEDDTGWHTKNSRLILPDDFFSKDGKYLLSWRVAIILDDDRYNTNFNYRELFDTNQKWDSPKNIVALEHCPDAFAIHSEILPESHGMTFIFRVHEVYQKLKQGKLREERYPAIPYLVFVDPKYARPWTEPNDILWKDLALGRIKPIHGSLFTYIGVDGGRHTILTPLTPIGWKYVFGM